MNKGIKPFALMLAIAAVACVGCSIKEDRNACPCSLTLDFSEVELSAAEVSEVHIEAPDGFLYHDAEAWHKMMESDDSGEVRRLYNVAVPKSLVGVSVICGAEGEFISGSGLSIPLGEECPEIFMYYSVLDAVMERRSELVRLNKEYCKIVIKMLPAEGEFPFKLNVRGGINGIGVDRIVAVGDFAFSFVPSSDGSGSVKVPRQKDNSLVLQVIDGTEILREFALGEFIAESGYDWGKESLDDVTVEIDYANSNLEIAVEEWSGNYNINIVI